MEIAPLSILVLIAFSVGIIAWWRGLWGLFDLYLLPKRPGLSNIISMVIGVVIVLLLVYFYPNIVIR